MTLLQILLLLITMILRTRKNHLVDMEYLLLKHKKNENSPIKSSRNHSQFLRTSTTNREILCQRLVRRKLHPRLDTIMIFILKQIQTLIKGIKPILIEIILSFISNIHITYNNFKTKILLKIEIGTKFKKIKMVDQTPQPLNYLVR